MYLIITEQLSLNVPEVHFSRNITPHWRM